MAIHFNQSAVLAEDMVFVEFFVPGEYTTIWVKDEPSCRWLPSGRNIRGEEPVREIRAHAARMR